MQTFMQTIIEAVKLFKDDLTKDWVISDSVENNLGVSFNLETSRFIGHVTVVEVPANPHLIIYLQFKKEGKDVWGKTTIDDIQFINFLNGLENKQAIGHRAPSDNSIPCGAVSRSF